MAWIRCCPSCRCRPGSRWRVCRSAERTTPDCLRCGSWPAPATTSGCGWPVSWPRIPTICRRPCWPSMRCCAPGRATERPGRRAARLARSRGWTYPRLTCLTVGDSLDDGTADGTLRALPGAVPGRSREVVRMRVTIGDVALHAGVSKTTVSRVLNDRGEVDAETCLLYTSD